MPPPLVTAIMVQQLTKLPQEISIEILESLPPDLLAEFHTILTLAVCEWDLPYKFRASCLALAGNVLWEFDRRRRKGEN